MTERIIQLANELIEEVQKAGHSIVHGYNHSEGTPFTHGKIEISLYDHKKDTVVVDNISGHWEVRGKLTAKVWEGQA